MPTILFAFFLLALLVLDTRSESCNRYRKAWHLLTQDERDTYSEAFHKLNRLGKMKTIGTVHHVPKNFEQGHQTSAFFHWHRYLIHEIESQIRDLGGKFECFALPYWDFSYEKGRSTNPYILDSGVGGNGDAEDTMRVSGSAWNKWNYPTIRDCNALEGVPCAMRRHALIGDESVVPTYAEMAAIITKYNYYGTTNNGQQLAGHIFGFKGLFQFGLHTSAHIFLGGGTSPSRKIIATLYAPIDPTFYLIHSWVDMVWSMWFSCHGHDKVALNDIAKHPAIYTEEYKDDSYPSCALSAPLQFYGLWHQDWSYYEQIKPTILKTMDFQLWDVTYQRGDFFDRSRIDELCPAEISKATFPVAETENDGVLFEDDLVEHEVKHRIAVFEQKLYEQLSETAESLSDIAQTWASHSCQYSTAIAAGDAETYEKCAGEYDPDSVEPCDEVWRDDAEQMGLEDALQGVQGNECLTRFRTRRFEFMKTYGHAWKLCNGDVDQYAYCEAAVIHVQDTVLQQIVDETEKIVAMRDSIESVNILVTYGRYHTGKLDVGRKSNVLVLVLAVLAVVVVLAMAIFYVYINRVNAFANGYKPLRNTNPFTKDENHFLVFKSYT